MDFKKQNWENSYKNKDNFVFYPHEEIIRFVSKYIRKKTGINEYQNINEMQVGLDLGCGIGRHVIYLDDMDFEAYGIDLSENAINFAKEWCCELNKAHLVNRVDVGSIIDMPYEDEFFDFVVSHGVLDSMSFKIARESIIETHRVMKKDGLFYLDLVSGDDGKHPREYNHEEIVSNEHEKGTIQSYFNWDKVNKLIDGHFEIVEAFLVQRESVISLSKNSRYHVILKKLVLK